jgi:hypothetical protein
VLAGVKRKIDSASRDIEKVEQRQRAVDRRLRDVGGLPEEESAELLSLTERLSLKDELGDAAA